MNKLIYIPLSIFVISFVISLIISFMLSQLIMKPRSVKGEQATPAKYFLDYENVSFTTKDNLTIKGWYIAGGSKRSVIAIHGGNDDKQAFLPLVETLSNSGFNTLLIDTRNHGDSDHDQVGLSLGLNESIDVTAAAEWLTREKGTESIGLIGVSQGSSAALLAASSNSLIKGVVLQSTGYDISDLYKNVFPIIPKFISDNAARILLWRAGLSLKNSLALNYPQIKAAHELEAPVFFISGDQDKIVGLSKAKELYSLVPGQKKFWAIAGAGHEIGFHKAKDIYNETVLNFFKESL